MVLLFLLFADKFEKNILIENDEDFFQTTRRMGENASIYVVPRV